MKTGSRRRNKFQSKKNFQQRRITSVGELRMGPPEVTWTEETVKTVPMGSDVLQRYVHSSSYPFLALLGRFSCSLSVVFP